MENFKVYVFTDSMRCQFKMGICNSIAELGSLKFKSLVFFEAEILTNRLVFFENYNTYDAALSQLENLKKMPQVLLMKMIRKSNPNWTDIWSENHLLEVSA